MLVVQGYSSLTNFVKAFAYEISHIKDHVGMLDVIAAGAAIARK